MVNLEPAAYEFLSQEYAVFLFLRQKLNCDQLTLSGAD